MHVITDGAGPCYNRSHHDALSDAPRPVSHFLGVRGWAGPAFADGPGLVHARDVI